MVIARISDIVIIDRSAAIYLLYDAGALNFYSTDNCGRRCIWYGTRFEINVEYTIFHFHI